MERKKAEHKRRLREQRSKAEKRIADALKMNQDILKKKKVDFDEKQREAHVRAKEVQERQDVELKQQAEKREKDHMLAMQRQQQAYKLEEECVDSIVAHREKKEDNLNVLRNTRKCQNDEEGSEGAC